MTFDAVSEDGPGPKWLARWHRSWPSYEAWFVARGGDGGPDAARCRAALARHMPELLATYDQLVAIAGGSDRAARFLSTWCPPSYLGGGSLAALADDDCVRLVRNYDLSPDLNEGLLLRSAWSGRPVMGMVEFLWGLSDGINDAGLCVALAYGGRSDTAEGFGITTILRYVLELCDTVAEALAALRRIPSHMAYNLVLADREGRTASVEMQPGGGFRRKARAIATNHQAGFARPARAAFTRTYERNAHLAGLRTGARDLHRHFRRAPLVQDRYGDGFGTLLTAEYGPGTSSMRLIWETEDWRQSLDRFEEGRRHIHFGAPAEAYAAPAATGAPLDWSLAAQIDWTRVARDYASGTGAPIATCLERASLRFHADVGSCPCGQGDPVTVRERSRHGSQPAHDGLSRSGARYATIAKVQPILASWRAGRV